ncbi:MAG TPA: carboxypeptidase-like regulatory domain-containing protein [Blastocatellia bacterium]|nr:carboxypeptidase-like regulatory domain-containing protein [Blastocatellia bacterium]
MNTELHQPHNRFYGYLAFVCVSLLVVFSCQTVSGQQEDSISGRVTTDDGRPLQNAQVALFKEGSAGARPLTTTNENGEFVFNHVPYGIYTISAFSFAYVDLSLDDRPNSRGRTYLPGDYAAIRMTKGGVIIGKVTNSRGEPAIDLPVFASRVHDPEGRPTRAIGSSGITDDRGIYRIFALLPGSYLVATQRSNSSGPSGEMPPYGMYPQTYYPSATRDTAREVMVTTGNETTGIDINLRDQQTGHTVSGQLNNQQWGAAQIVAVRLTNLKTNAVNGSTVRLNDPDRSFIFQGVEDGEYELASSFTSGNIGFSTPTGQKVTVKGADVTGLKLTFVRMGALTGQFAFEDKAATQLLSCDKKTKMPFQEMVVSIKSDESSRSSTTATNIQPHISAANEKGEFAVYTLPAGQYRISAELPSEDLYISKITSNNRSETVAGSSPDLVSVTSGGKAEGITIIVGQGAAGISGKLHSGEPIFDDAYQVFLVPIDSDAANYTWRYYDSRVETDGKFAITNIIPGKYWIIARSSLRSAKGVMPADEVFWDKSNREKLRQEAEKNGKEIEFTSCQRIKDQVLSLSSK